MAQYSYAQLVEAFKQAYPGEFDRYSPADLADAILREAPGLEHLLDPATKGLELIPADQRGGVIWPGTTSGAPTPLPPPPPVIPPDQPGHAQTGIKPPWEGSGRPQTIGDMAITTGLRVVPAVAGGITGAALGGFAAPGFAFGGGALGETLAQYYERTTGIDETISPLNIMAQGGLNVFPLGQMIRGVPWRQALMPPTRAATKAARVAGTPLPAAPVTTRARRIGSNLAEGATMGFSGTALETGLERGRAPTFEEAAFSTLLGAGFGVGVSGGEELVRAGARARQAGRDAPDPAVVAALHQDILIAPDPAQRQTVIDQLGRYTTLVARSHPEQAREIFAQTAQVVHQRRQMDAQQLAATFLQTLQARAPELSGTRRQDLSREFLDQLTATQLLGAEELSRFKTALDEVLLQAPPYFDAPLGPTLEGAPMTREQLDAQNRIEAGPGAGVLTAPPAPPAPRSTLQQPTLKGVPPESATRPWTLRGPDPTLPLPPAFRPQGVERVAPVVRGDLTRDEAYIAQWILDDLDEFRFQQGGQNVEQLNELAVGQGRPGFIPDPHGAGSQYVPLFQRLGFTGNGSTLRAQLDKWWTGRTAGNNQAVRILRSILPAYVEAWDPVRQRFDFEQGTSATRQALRTLDAGGTVRYIVPQLLPPERIRVGRLDDPEDAMPADLLGRYLTGEERVLPLPGGFQRAARLMPAELDEARSFFMMIDDDELIRLYDDAVLEGRGPRPQDPELPPGDLPQEIQTGLLIEEIQRRGLRELRQPALSLEGPGTPGRRSIQPDLFRTGEEGPAPAPRPEPEAVVPPREEQPALPGDVGAVRAIENPTPLLMSEADLFQLTPPPGHAPLPKAPSLFDVKAEEGVAGRGAPPRARGRRRGYQPHAPNRVAMDEAQFRELQDAVRQAGDREMVGMLLGDPDGSVRRVIPVQNTAEDTRTAFRIAPDTFAAIARQAAKLGLEVIGSVHSQPTGRALPSRKDLRGSVADLPLLIIGSKGGEIRDVQVWQPGGKDAPWLEGDLLIGSLAGAQRPIVPKRVAQQMIAAIPTYKGAPGDVPALQHYLDAHREEFWSEPWFVKADEKLKAGDARGAWLETQIAQIAYAKVGRQLAQSPQFDRTFQKQLADAVDAKLEGGAQDPFGALFALFDGRTDHIPGVGRVVMAPDIPPPLHGKGITVGRGGILHPGLAEVPLPTKQVVESMSLAAVNDILQDVKWKRILDNPEKLSGTRLVDQITEQLLLRSPSESQSIKAWTRAMRKKGLSEREINHTVASHFRESIRHSARMLASLSVMKRTNREAITLVDGVTGAAGDLDDLLLVGAGGRQLGRLGDLAPANTFKDIIQPGRAWDRVLALNDLQTQQIGGFTALEGVSRPFMLSQIATAARNLWSATGRWGIEAYGEVMSGAIAGTMGRSPEQALRHWKKAADLVRYAPILRPGGWVMPWHARQAQFESIFDASARLAQFQGKEYRQIMGLLGDFTDEHAHFLGSTVFGEPTPHRQSKYAFLNWLSTPRVQNTLTMFNRAQEFTIRSGMYVIAMRDGMRRRGLDPDLLNLPKSDLVRALGGDDEFGKLVHGAVAHSLDVTFSGDLVRGGLGKSPDNRPFTPWHVKLIDFINDTPAVRAGYPFPKFNFSAAPRFIWDYGGLAPFVEPILSRVFHRGRYFLGQKGRQRREVLIPEAKVKLADALADEGMYLRQIKAVDDEIRTRKKLLNRALKKVEPGRPELPGIRSKISQLRDAIDGLEQAQKPLLDQYEAARSRQKDLHSQVRAFEKTLEYAEAARAPETYAEVLGRSVAGVSAMLLPAILLRAEQRDKGTAWYELRYEIPGVGDTVIDTRAFAPFTQLLFIGDVLDDLWANTDRLAAWDDMLAGVRPDEAIYQRYEGKYTQKTLGNELVNAFLSMSQIAGTTLAVLDRLAAIKERGLPTSTEMGDTVMEAIGGFLARFTIPFAQLKAVSDLFDDEESRARITDPKTQGWAAPLVQPLGNLPFLGKALIPDTYNQLSGQPLDTFMPQARALLGVTLRQWDRMRGEVLEAGVPGASVYLRSTRDPLVDKLVASHYSRLVGEFADQLVFQNEYYQSLDSPANRRDYLQGAVFPGLKQHAYGLAMMDLGWDRVQRARETPEMRRRRIRTEGLLAAAEEDGITFRDTEDLDDTGSRLPGMEEPGAGGEPDLEQGFEPAPPSPF